MKGQREGEAMVEWEKVRMRERRRERRRDIVRGWRGEYI
jgi:hypothetical protein